MTDHPITPPPHLMNQWESEAVEECRSKQNYFGFERETLKLIKAARWGADQELEACCDFLQELLTPSEWITGLRHARRPKPPSLKEQALLAIDTAVADGRLSPDVSNVVRRALEALPE